MQEKFRLQVKDHFDAAHFIRDYDGKCNRMHGHRWAVEVVFEGNHLDARNILVDFGDVKRVMKSLVDKLDHFVLNEVLDEPNVTAEFLARWFFERLDDFIVDGWRIRVVRTCIWESPDCCVKYYKSPDFPPPGPPETITKGL